MCWNLSVCWITLLLRARLRRFFKVFRSCILLEFPLVRVYYWEIFIEGECSRARVLYWRMFQGALVKVQLVLQIWNWKNWVSFLQFYPKRNSILSLCINFQMSLAWNSWPWFVNSELIKIGYNRSESKWFYNWSSCPNLIPAWRD